VQAAGRLVIAVDGKIVRGERNKTGKAPHLVAAFAHGIGAVLGQAAVDEKSNEIPARLPGDLEVREKTQDRRSRGLPGHGNTP
jgi:hypothetical protein